MKRQDVQAIKDPFHLCRGYSCWDREV